jgi:cytochrome c oxidase subunit 2
LQGEREAGAVAAYFSRLPARAHVRTVRGDTAQGRQLYQACIGCHGAAGQGNLLVKGPPLNVQEDWYLLDQMRKFKSGSRGSHPLDVEGQMMRYSVQGMEDEALRDVIAYVGGFGVETNTPAGRKDAGTDGPGLIP